MSVRLDVYVYQSVRIVICKGVYEYWYHAPVITTTASKGGGRRAVGYREVA